MTPIRNTSTLKLKRQTQLEQSNGVFQQALTESIGHSSFYDGTFIYFYHYIFYRDPGGTEKGTMLRLNVPFIYMYQYRSVTEAYPIILILMKSVATSK